MAAIFGAADRTASIEEQCQAKGIPFRKFDNFDNAVTVLRQVEQIESFSVADLKKEFQRWAMTLEVGLEKQDMVSKLKDVEVWKELPLLELQKLCQERKYNTAGKRDDLIKRLASGANSARSVQDSRGNSKYKNFFSYGKTRETEKEKGEPKSKQEQRKPSTMYEKPFASGNGHPFNKAKTWQEVEFEKAYEAQAEANRKRFAAGERNHAGMPNGQRRNQRPYAGPDTPDGRQRRVQAPPPPSMDKYFATLSLTKTSTPNEVRTAYRRLALQYHPDKNPGEAKAVAEERFREVVIAYDKVCEYLKQRSGMSH